MVRESLLWFLAELASYPLSAYPMHGAGRRNLQPQLLHYAATCCTSRLLHAAWLDHACACLVLDLHAACQVPSQPTMEQDAGI